MADAVQFFFLPGVFGLFDHAVHIIINGTAGDDPCLAASVHRQLVKIVVIPCVCHVDPVRDLRIEQLSCLFVYTVRIGIDIIGKLGLRPVDI